MLIVLAARMMGVSVEACSTCVIDLKKRYLDIHINNLPILNCNRLQIFEKTSWYGHFLDFFKYRFVYNDKIDRLL